MKGPKSTDLKVAKEAGMVDGSGCRRVAATGVDSLEDGGGGGAFRGGALMAEGFLTDF